MRHAHVKMAVDANQRVELACLTRAHPAPTITWSTNITSLDDVTKYSVTSRGGSDGGGFPFGSALSIGRVQQDDLGVYVCTARNNMGVNTTSFNLTVKSKQLLPHHHGRCVHNGYVWSLTICQFGWRRGSLVRTLVFGWRTFIDLCLIYG